MNTPSTSLTVRKMLPCPPEIAFRAWTQPALFQQWFLPQPGKVSATFDLRLGGKYRISFEPNDGDSACVVQGEFLTIKEPHHLEYTWISETDGSPETWTRTVVRVEFNAVEPERTEIVLTHDRFADETERDNHNRGWTNIITRMAEAMLRPPIPTPAS